MVQGTLSEGRERRLFETRVSNIFTFENDPSDPDSNISGKVKKFSSFVKSLKKDVFGITSLRKNGIQKTDTKQGGQSRDTHVVISHVLFSFFSRFKVCFTIIFLLFGGFQKCHLVQSTQTRKLFLMALKF